MNAVTDKVNPLRPEVERKNKIPLPVNVHVNPRSIPVNFEEMVPTVVIGDHRLSKSSKYVSENIVLLELWSGKKYSRVLFDSELDGRKSSVYRDRVMNQGQLYFIVIDDQDNAFGYYHPSVLNKLDTHILGDIFMFTLNSNGRCIGAEKFDRKKDKEPVTTIFSDRYYEVYSSGFGYHVNIIGAKEGSILYANILMQSFEGMKRDTLVGKSGYAQYFNTNRLVVVQMK